MDFVVFFWEVGGGGAGGEEGGLGLSLIIWDQHQVNFEILQQCDIEEKILQN